MDLYAGVYVSLEDRKVGVMAAGIEREDVEEKCRERNVNDWPFKVVEILGDKDKAKAEVTEWMLSIGVPEDQIEQAFSATASAIIELLEKVMGVLERVQLEDRERAGG